MRVTLKTTDPSSYFTVSAPGAQEAMFIGSTSGNTFTTKLPSSGDYTVNVYLMRNAARRKDVANYTVTIRHKVVRIARIILVPSFHRRFDRQRLWVVCGLSRFA